MGTEDEEADGHRRISLLQLGMLPREELIQGDEVPERLTHLLSVDGDHIVVHPVANEWLTMLRCLSLSYLALVVRED